MKKRFNNEQPGGKQGPSQRQLRVGEAIKKGLSEIFLRGGFFHGDLRGTSVTVSEVRITPDLKNAMAFVMPLGGLNSEKVIKYLTDNAGEVRYQIAQKINMKFSPKINFKLDNTYEYAAKIDSLLQQPTVRKDLEKDKSDD